MGLKEYKAKRNFRQTQEPSESGDKGGVQDDFFVIQKHDATRLHYDFRLSMEGVLKSWAVPKGFPTSTGERHLAVQVEDHPIDYARFEGTIPKGNYGAGTVMVWDIGTYEILDPDPLAALKRGKFHVVLKGSKLKGEWGMVRMKPRPGEDKAQWLLFKSGQNTRPISARAEDQSVLTRRSLQQIAIDNDAQWQSNRIADRAQHSTPQPKLKSAGRRTKIGARMKSTKNASSLVAGQARLPSREVEFVEPMKALTSESLPRGEQWIYELKFDGIRGLALKRNDSVRLISRNEKDLTSKYPEISSALRELPGREAILDGEIVALDSTGKPSFQLLQSANMPGEERPPIFYYIFDVLQLDGKDLTGLPLMKRKAMVEALLRNAPVALRYSAGIDAQSDRVLKEMQARGLEGLIAKQRESKYEIGRRGGAWVKFKWTNEQEFVIGGYTEPQGSRSHFGAVLVGYYEGDRLMFCSKVGTGFNERLLKALHQQFQRIKREKCPFANLPEKRRSSRWGRPFTAAEMRRCTWVEPKFVCQVRFAEWTRDGHLRQPAFVGLREDKDPRSVVREMKG